MEKEVPVQAPSPEEKAEPGAAPRQEPAEGGPMGGYAAQLRVCVCSRVVEDEEEGEVGVDDEEDEEGAGESRPWRPPAISAGSRIRSQGPESPPEDDDAN